MFESFDISVIFPLHISYIRYLHVYIIAASLSDIVYTFDEIVSVFLAESLIVWFIIKKVLTSSTHTIHNVYSTRHHSSS